MEVKRYECGNGEGVFRDNNGFLVFYEDYAKLKSENEELNEWTKTVVDRFNNLNGQHTQLKQENEELRKVKKDLDIQVKFKEAYLGHWQDSKEENTKLKERVKELLIKNK